jgi:hypothetical protein
MAKLSRQGKLLSPNAENPNSYKIKKNDSTVTRATPRPGSRAEYALADMKTSYKKQTGKDVDSKKMMLDSTYSSTYKKRTPKK